MASFPVSGGVVAFAGSRGLRDAGLALVDEQARGVVARGHHLSVGCCVRAGVHPAARHAPAADQRGVRAVPAGRPSAGGVAWFGAVVGLPRARSWRGYQLVGGRWSARAAQGAAGAAHARGGGRSGCGIAGVFLRSRFARHGAGLRLRVRAWFAGGGVGARSVPFAVARPWRVGRPGLFVTARLAVAARSNRFGRLTAPVILFV